MAQRDSPSITAAALHRVDRAAALAVVDSLLGKASEWRSALLRYRLASEFQSDWKEEIGHWLQAAQEHGFLQRLLERVLKRAKTPSKLTEVDPNDKHHLVVLQELAPAMAVYYLTGTQWAFGAWEPVSGRGEDVDFEMAAPDGRPVFFQAKAPDQPGRVEGGRRRDGELDERVLKALEHAAKQLPKTGPQAKFIVVSACRVWPLSQNVGFLVSELVGQTVQRDVVVLSRSRLGKFWRPEWQHVSGVVLLDYLRGLEFRYACTVLLNPSLPVCDLRDWFPHARVSWFDGDAFHWERGEPGEAHFLPDGTRLAP